MIRIICVGKLKEKYWQDAFYEYVQRIEKYTKVEIIEVMDEGKGDAEYILKQEEARILKYLRPKDYLITLEIEGKDCSSLEFSRLIADCEMRYSNICFLIGGSYGLSDTLKKQSNYALSFSKMTFPHQLFRILLLEQIYRAYKIQNHESYHK